MNLMEWAKEHHTPLLIGGGGLVLYLVLRNRPAAIAATAPSDGQQVPVGTAPPAAQPELDATAQQAQALQLQQATQAMDQQNAANNLALLAAHQQMQFQGQQQQEQLAQQTRMDEQQYYLAQQYGKMVHQQLRNMTPTGGFLGALQKFGQTVTDLITPAAQVYGMVNGVPPVPQARPQARPVQMSGGPNISFPTFTPPIA